MRHKLQITEDQAIALVKLFHEERYLPIEGLHEKLRVQHIPRVSLPFVVAYLTGYLAAKTYDSPFDVAIFGEQRVVFYALLFLCYYKSHEQSHTF